MMVMELVVVLTAVRLVTARTYDVHKMRAIELIFVFLATIRSTPG